MRKEKDSNNATSQSLTQSALSSAESNPGRRFEQGTMPLFTIAGIQLRIHVVFLAIVLVLGIQTFTDGVWKQALYLPSALAALALHELGHALAARRRGQASCTVIIHPLLAQPPATRTLRDPKGEALTALAGPLVSAVVSSGMAAALFVSGHLTRADLYPSALFSDNPAIRFFAFNLYLCLVNLLPFFPLDGGRALRCALASASGDLRATQAVGVVTLLGALAFGAIGLHTANFLVLLFTLLFLSGIFREAHDSPFQVARASGLIADDVARQDVRTLSPGMTVGEAAKAVAADSQSQYPIVLGRDILGVVARQQITGGDSAAYLSGVMTRQFFCVKESDSLAPLIQRGLPSYARPIAVTTTGTAQGDFVSLLCAESVHTRLISEAERLRDVPSTSEARPTARVTTASESNADEKETMK